jgi:hypothetical protein
VLNIDAGSYTSAPEPLFQSASGIGPAGQVYDVSNPHDRIFAFDYYNTGVPSTVVCYRPGYKVCYIIDTNSGTGTFFDQTLFESTNGIGGYDLSSTGDQMFAFDVDGNGHKNALVCYRPGTGVIFILRQNSTNSFSNCYPTAQ